jgi:hypothetical protein
MGWCLTWFAVKGKDPETVRAELGLHFTGERVSSPIPRIAGAGLPGGWYLVQRLRHECRDAAVYARLSAGCEVVSLFVEEHVMVSSASGWKDGRRLWSVVHEYEQGARHLETNGDLPAEFAVIRDKVLADKDAGSGDYFAIPCDLASALTGYRYDAPPSDKIVSSFEVLARPSWWSRLFG